MRFIWTYYFQNVFSWSLKCIVLICISIMAKTQYIYKAPPFFCAFTCTLGFKTAAQNGIFTCPTPDPIQQVAKYGFGVSEISKGVSMNSIYSASAVPVSSTNTTRFNVTLGIETGDNVYFTFTIVAIGYQAQNTWIDLFNHFLNNDMFNTLITCALSIRNYTVNHLVTGQTRFLSTTNLDYATFISYYSMVTLSDNTPAIVSFNAMTLLGGFTSNYIQTIIEIPSGVGLNYFGGMVIVFDNAEMSMMGAIKLVDYDSITVFNVWDLGAKYPQWGPRFNSKCILGINFMSYLYSQKFDLYFANSIKQNFQGITNSAGNSNTYSTFQYVFFCVSKGDTECNEDFPFYDALDQGCYMASSCPVPTVNPGIYPTAPQLCKLCTEADCTNCEIGSRTYCLECNSSTFTEAIFGDCQCIAGYYRSLASYCEINCTYHIPNCKLTNCSSQTTCTECEVGFLIALSVVGNECKSCGTFIPNCLQCVAQTQCSLCETKYYLETGSMSEVICTECNLTFPYCETCTPGNSGPICNTCYPGYIHTTPACICSTVNLTGCASCNIPTECTQCRAAFYLHPVTKHCQLCTTLFQCQTCASYNECTMCNQYFKPYYNASDGSMLCKSCGQLMPGCIDCAWVNVCTSCATGYGLNSNYSCTLCSILHPHCISCTNSLACLQCQSNNYTFLINGKCRVCSDINSQCINCQINTISGSLQCINCMSGYVLIVASQICYKCSQQIDDCEQCIYNSVSGKAECTLCSDLFLVDQNLTCQKCKQGFYVTRSCSLIQGCASSHIINGTVICLMCDSLFNFFFNTTSKKCQCQQGFVLDSTQSRCIQQCGDSIVNMMECDDGNAINGDGCSDKCEIQSGFQCNVNKKGVSQCVLNQEISVVFDYMLRDLEGNKVNMYFTVTPAYTALSKVDWKKTITFNFSQTIQTSVSYSDGILLVSVQYGSDIDQKMMQMQFSYDPSITKSNPQSLKMKMSAVNGPLTYESASNLTSLKVFSVSGLVLGILCFLFYLISSYFHKMIGLETIQFIQLIYYVRLIAPGSGSSSLYGLNSLKYANGYNDIVDQTSDMQAYYRAVPKELVKLNLKLQFLENCNLMLIPLAIALIAYVVYFIKSSQARSFYMRTKQISHKDNYITKRRQLDFIYDSFIFPFTLSLFYVAIFSMLAYELSTISSAQNKPFSSLSFGCCSLIIFFVSIIFCFELINGIQKYFQQKESKENVKSDEKNLDHDANAAQYAFHPLYVSVYLTYQLIIMTAVCLVFAKFTFFSEIVLILTLIYLGVIINWKPYSLKIHNLAIIFNQSFVVYMVVLQVFSKYKIVGSLPYNIGLYLTMVLVLVSLMFQILRVYIHNKTIKAQYSLKKTGEQKDESETDTGTKKKQKPHNPYSLESQVVDKKFIDRSNMGFTFIDTSSPLSDKNSKTSDVDEFKEPSGWGQKINNKLKASLRNRFLSRESSPIKSFIKTY